MALLSSVFLFDTFRRKLFGGAHESDTMSDTTRIGILGLSHDHIWGELHALAPLEGQQLLVAADPAQELRDKVAAEFGCETTDSYHAVIERDDVDAVFVYGSNRTGAEIAAKAAAAGKHVMIEKPMAADLAGAEKLVKAAEDANVQLMVNWPFAWWPQLQHALKLVEEAEIGRVWQVRYRAAHQGPRELGCSKYFCDWIYDPKENGGGALMDYCCYGANLASVVLGLPDSVTGEMGLLCKTGIEVEDNALLILKYPNSIATTEASWTQIGKITAYQTTIFGEWGTILVEPHDGGGILLADEQKPEGYKVEIPETPDHMKSAPAHFLWLINGGGPVQPLCDPKHGHNAQAILEAGTKSAEEGRRVNIY